MQLHILGLLTLCAGLSLAIQPTKTWRGRRNNGGQAPSDKFMSARGGQFFINGSAFRFVGTNAYWLQTLNTEQDRIDTFSNMSAANITVVKTFAFNDVEVIPENGTWFQLIQNGTTIVNNGTNGIAILDALIRHAENAGIYLLFSLTNNWNPRPLFDNITASVQNLSVSVQTPGLFRRDVTPGTNNSLPRNTLSNDYGGMDVYVRQFGLSNHDDFYTNATLKAAFKNYTTEVVSRYVNSSAIFAWEVANDPRCSSSVPATQNCNSTTVTSWLDEISQHIRSIDPNHLISAGNEGFFCVDCPKLFPRVVPPPGPSAVPNVRKRGVQARPLTRARLLAERKEAWKKTRARLPKPSDGVRIRGNWVATPTRRQFDVGLGSAFDGSQGVDCEDIINIPQIGFGSFQLFPDQVSYGADDPSLSHFNSTVELGLEWIRRQAEVASLFGKPISLTGFGLVTQDNAPFFVPFNTSIAPFAPDNIDNSSGLVQPYGVTDQQRDDAYAQWLDAGIAAGLQGMIQYQWGQGNLTVVNNTAIVPDINSNDQSPDIHTNGMSPNDGYSTLGKGRESLQETLQSAFQGIAEDGT